MATQQNDNSGQTSLAISPSLIVGIVILASFACTIIFASIFRYCRRGQSALIDPESMDETGGTDYYNPNKQRSAAQVARLREVRWVNNMYAWERGRQARLAIGEIRPTTMLMGRKGENKNWDEYTIAGDNSWQNDMGTGNAKGGCSHAPYFYNVEDPYARCNSQQRLSHLAPPTDQFRNSYQSTCSGNGYLPRYPSALLPPPVNGRRDALLPGTVAQKSPLRNEYQFEGHEQGPSATFSPGPPFMHNRAEDVAMHHFDGRQSPFVNPKITVSDESQATAYMRSPPTLAYDHNFETVALDGNAEIATDNWNADTNQRSNLSPSPEVRDHRPSVIVTNDEPYPQLQLQFLPQSLSQQSVSVYDDGEVGKCNGSSESPVMHSLGRESQQNNERFEENERNANGHNEIRRENVKDMIQEWERANGSFGRSH
ncbi:hypothetical protein AYO21_04744 [Fonsecaea monophora]|uniref:Uncharacterized protein n=1 Tax=Fonsecaea monophora TaxID=254056 RepID=A0A177FBU2_9EURO|nr:hypothetical protein AYO21_04744 [Fonsecaea monophora]KAH0839151.1 hypothetical protein FOPE_05454 [Fonsecaea pedrosoi]OAG41131.1 hypothetical protein AYO21_04744 [Fonsecaea monophora]